MVQSRPDSDRILRGLSVVTTMALAVVLLGAVVVLLGAPVAKLFPSVATHLFWGLPVPAAVARMEAPVQTSWGQGRLEVEDARGVLRLPLDAMPWWLFGLLWSHTATMAVLSGLFLHHLRRLLRRARDGDVFNPGNVFDVRRLGVLLLYVAVLDAAVGFVASWFARPLVTGDTLAVATGLHGNGALVLAVFVLWALAEVFRRGAELESEQSLVV